VASHPIDRDAELEPAAAPDRRRAGRLDDVSPALIPLLRGDSSDQLRDYPIDEEPDQLGAFRGIIIWTLISAVFFALLWWVL
jgi:hypothetical protein